MLFFSFLFIKILLQLRKKGVFMKLLKQVLAVILFFSTFLHAEVKNELLFYVGITMVKPVNELAKNFEKTHNCTIKILQGGSQDLYDSIKSSQVGDLYLPGSTSYRDKYIKDGLLLDGKFVGFNKLALVVKKGNPKNIKPTLDELLNEKYKVVIGNEQSGSVGEASKKLLTKNEMYEKVISNAIFLVPDSRNLINTLKNNEADLVLNWYATTFWDDNKEFVEALPMDDKYADKAKLVFNLLSTSQNKELSKKFMDYASSAEGREVFKKYGFLNDEDMKNFDKVVF